MEGFPREFPRVSPRPRTSANTLGSRSWPRSRSGRTVRDVTADPLMPDDDAESGAGQRFLDLAKRLIAVPKDEVERLRRERPDDQGQPE